MSESPRWWIFSAPSDEITVNDVSEPEGNGTTLTTTAVEPGSGFGLTQVNVKIHAVNPTVRSALADDGARNVFGGMATTDTAGLSSSSRSINKPICPLWSKFTHLIHRLILGVVVETSVHAARNPKIYATSVVLLSFGLFAAGLLTNFQVNTDEQVIYAPFKSKPKAHAEWIKNDSGFPGNARFVVFNVHADGDNIFSTGNIRRAFEILDEVRSIPGYDDVCSQGDYVDFDDVRTCKIMSVTRFFKHDVKKFDKIYNEGGDESIIEAISADSYENLTPVDSGAIFGKPVYDEKTDLIASMESYKIYILVPNVDGAKELEGRVLERASTLQAEWDADDSPLELEYFSMRSYSDEFARAIEQDLFLLPVVFMLMSGFTCLVFFRCDRVHSRSFLGMGSVITIVLALMSSFGIMFMIGVPFTNMTLILPFIIFGVGLDDAFIITGAYFRTDPSKDTVDRIRESMEEIGLSITVTSITTMVAFILGCISTIPAIYWLNLYAFPTIVIDFFFQITFFVALIVLDERRIQANRMDWCCICVKVNSKEEDWDSSSNKPERVPVKSFPERFMRWYTKQLLRPYVKALVVIGFLGYFAFCGYTTSKLTQEFNMEDLLPDDSYVKAFLYSMKTYSSRLITIGIYFRGDFNQLDPDMQQQMKKYIDELSELPQLADEPPFCWFRDFEKIKDSPLAETFGFNDNMTLQEQIDHAFTIPAIEETYGSHVVRDEHGNITASRCFTYIERMDLTVVKEQLQFLKDQKAITARQPINIGAKDWSFFTFDPIYFIWEFYAVAVSELISTTVSGVIAVTIVGIFFFPHWKANFFAFPLIIMLYIDLLGTLQWAGLYINAVTYVCLVISIGLMVDFIVHVLLRYYESKEMTRDAKVIDTLETMGASILVGGLSTALGVLPLALSTSEIMTTVFISFFAIITLGILHGLVFLPVVLSYCGPLVQFVSDPLTDTGDLALKENELNDTDDSSSSDGSHAGDKAQNKLSSSSGPIISSKQRPNYSMASRSNFGSFDSHPSSRSSNSRHQVLHSSTTVREENLEVVEWQPTMAWI